MLRSACRVLAPFAEQVFDTGQALELPQPARQLQYRAQALVAEAGEVRRSGAGEVVLRRGEEPEFGLGQVGQLLVEEVGRRDVEEAGERGQVVDRRVVLGARCAAARGRRARA